MDDSKELADIIRTIYRTEMEYFLSAGYVYTAIFHSSGITTTGSVYGKAVLYDSGPSVPASPLYIPLQSSPPDALTYFLNEAGLTVGEDVEIIYTSTAKVAPPCWPPARRNTPP